MIQKIIRRMGRKAFGWGLQPDWSDITRGPNGREWARRLDASRDGEKVLVATSVGGFAAGTVVESTLAIALTLRGADVHVLLCDEFLPACHQAISRQFPIRREFARHGPSRVLCRTCYRPAARMFEAIGVKVHRYSELVTEDELVTAEKVASDLPSGQIPSFRIEGDSVGEHALAGALRFFARGDLRGERYGEAVLRRYLKAAVLTTFAARRLLGEHQFISACFNHGLYVPQGLIGEVARSRGVRVVNWNVAYRRRCFIFSHHDTYHHELLSEPTSVWEHIEWSKELEDETLAYLKSRWYGTQDWVYFHEKPREALSAISAECGIDFSRPCIGMLSNVIWDAQLHYPANAFPNMLEWVLRSIRYFSTRSDLQLIVRIHPAEIRGNIASRQRLWPEIQKAFATLPRNVFVIKPESRISTYAVMGACDAVLIYGTKTGVELCSQGIPVIVAGEAWIRGKGISLDASSAEDYFALLDKLPLGSRLSEEVVLRARKYAFHFFFRRMIPLSFMVEQPGDWPPYCAAIRTLAELEPGRELGLDVICDGILKGTDFVYPHEDARKGRRGVD